VRGPPFVEKMSRFFPSLGLVCSFIPPRGEQAASSYMVEFCRSVLVFFLQPDFAFSPPWPDMSLRPSPPGADIACFFFLQNENAPWSTGSLSVIFLFSPGSSHSKALKRYRRLRFLIFRSERLPRGRTPPFPFGHLIGCAVVSPFAKI